MTKRKNPEDYLPTGRPTIMTNDVVAKLETAFSMGCTDVEACLYANINKATLYRYQQENPDFCDRKEQLKEKLVLKARSVIADALNKKDENTAKWYLERKCKNEFSTKVESDVNLINEQPFEIKIIE